MHIRKSMLLLLFSSLIMQISADQVIQAYHLPRITEENINKGKSDCIQSFDQAKTVRLVIIPTAAVIGGALVYYKWDSIKSIGASGTGFVAGVGKRVFNSGAWFFNGVGGLVGHGDLITLYDLNPVAIPVDNLTQEEIVSLRRMMSQFALWSFLGSVVKGTAVQCASQGALYAFRSICDEGAQDIALFARQSTSLLMIKNDLREWLQEMQAPLEESAIEYLQERMHELDTQIMLDTEKVIAFMYSLKEYKHISGVTFDKQTAMLINAANAFAEDAEHNLNNCTQEISYDNRQLLLKSAVNRALSFIATVEREMNTFKRVIKLLQK